MSYTTKNLNVNTLLLTILIFLFLLLISSQISILTFNPYNTQSKTIYSKIIPIKEKSENFQTIIDDNSIKGDLIKYSRVSEENINELSNRNQEEQYIDEMNQKEHDQIQVEQLSQNKKQTQRDVINANKNSSWRIQIPKLGLDVHIQEGTTSSILLKAVGHFEDSSKWNGNVCLAAHNRGYKCNFFQKIKDLKVGDEVIYLTKQGKKIYKVQTNKAILETDWNYLKETKDNRITLITCIENRREYRRCVQAVQVSEEIN